MKLRRLAILVLAGAAFAQAPPKDKPQPLPKGETKVLQAVVMEVKGVAQARREAKGKWEKLAVNDVLAPGAVVRTGRKSSVALRVGPNASLLIERQSRVAIPAIVQSGAVLKTRVSMSFGKVDVRVDRIGLDNDFEVSTPTATLAVRGTAFRIWWDVVNEFRSIGVPGNKLRAIEVRYLRDALAHLSRADSTSDEYKLPALDGFYKTYLEPLLGAVGEGEYGDPAQDPERLVDPVRETGVKAARAQRGSEQDGRTAQLPPGFSDNPPPTGSRTQEQEPPPDKKQ